MADGTSGWLFKMGAKGLIKGWKKRFCVLESGRVYYYTSSSPEQRATTCKGFIDLLTGLGKEQTGKVKSDLRHVFEIRTPDRTWYLAAESEAERTTWIEALETSVTILCKDRTSTSLLSGGNPDPVSANRSPEPGKRTKGLLKSSSSRFKRFFKGKEADESVGISRSPPSKDTAVRSRPANSSPAPRDRDIVTRDTTTQPAAPASSSNSSDSPSASSHQRSISSGPTESSTSSNVETSSDQKASDIARPGSPFARMHREVEEHMVSSNQSTQRSTEDQQLSSDTDLSSSEEILAPVANVNTRDEGATVPTAPVFSGEEDNEDSSLESDDEFGPVAPVAHERLSIYEVQNRISMNLKKMQINPAFMLVSESANDHKDNSEPSGPERASEPAPAADHSRPASLIETAGAYAISAIPPVIQITSVDSMPPADAPLVSAPISRPASSDTVSRRTKKAREIIQTELYYLECLSTMLVHYMVPLRLAVQERTLDFELTEDDIKALFSTALTPIVDIHSKFIQSLQSRFDAWNDAETKIADVILDAANGFNKSYIEYCANYDKAVTTYDRLCSHSSFSQLLLQFKLNSGKSLGLNHLLIMPVQRIPRYKLLLDELLRDTPEAHPDYTDIKRASETVERVAGTINDGIRRRESMRRMQLQYEELADAHRYLIYEGFIDTKASTGKQNTKFAVFNDLLLSISKQNAKNRQIIALPSSSRPLLLVWLKQDFSAPLTWDIITPRKTYTIEQKLPEEVQFLNNLTNALKRILGTNDVKQFSDKRRCRYVFSETVAYDGEWNVGQMEGFGRMYYAQVGVYEGQFSKDERHGEGKMTWYNGIVYNGTWVNGKRSGKGTMTWPNGDKYVGEFVDGRRQGHGIMSYSTGSKYEGEWQKDQPHGRGSLVSTFLGSYEGMWENGKFHGIGQFTDAGGATYQGEWHKGKRHGMGMYRAVATNGRVETYIGSYVDDLRHGEGKMTFFDGSFYEGRWDQNERHGLGKFFFSPEDLIGRESYHGDWNHGKMTGTGELIFKNGDRCVGTFIDAILHSDNAKFSTKKDGRETEGRVNNGNLDGAVTITHVVDGSSAPRMIPMAVYGTEMYQMAKKVTGPSFLINLESNLVWPRLGAPVEPLLPHIDIPKI